MHVQIKTSVIIYFLPYKVTNALSGISLYDNPCSPPLLQNFKSWRHKCKGFCKLPDHIGYSFNVLLIPDVNQIFILFYVLPQVAS